MRIKEGQANKNTNVGVLFVGSKPKTQTTRMKHYKLSVGKRLTKPILFGTVLVGLATVFFNRHKFLEDVEDLRAQERARNDVRRLEVLERRQRQREELAEKKKQEND